MNSSSSFLVVPDTTEMLAKLKDGVDGVMALALAAAAAAAAYKLHDH